MTYKTTVPGLPGGELETSHPIKIKLVPEWRTLNRPGIAARTPRRSVQHGNANPNSTAAGEANYLYNGAGGRQASYHSATDDRETWVMVPADEVTWQAADGGGPGNMNGFSNEMVEDAALWADPQRRARVIENAAEFMGKVAARLNIARPERHWDFNAGDPGRHHCPDKLMSLGLWATYEAKWHAYRAAEAARMKGEAAPAPVVKGGRMKTTDALNVRAGWGLKHKIVTTLPAGTTVEVIADGEGRVYAEYDGYQWVNIKGAFGTGWAALDWLAKITDPATPPAPKPETVAFTTRYELPLREAAGFGGAITATLPEGTAGAILDGPKRVDGIDWYRARINGGGTGWVPASILRTLDMGKAA